MRIAVLATCDDNFEPISSLTIPVFKEYCFRLTYEFIFCKERLSDRHPVWDKIALIQKVLDQNLPFDWYMFADTDLLIMNHTIKLENFIDDNVDFIGCNDCHAYNAGVFFFKNNEFNKDFFSKVWNINQNDHRLDGRFNMTQGEQKAMAAIMNDQPNKEQHFKMVSQKQFNCYDYTLYNRLASTEGQFEMGDFIIHFPGLSLGDRVRHIREYKEKIIR